MPLHPESAVTVEDCGEAEIKRYFKFVHGVAKIPVPQPNSGKFTGTLGKKLEN